MNMQWDGRFDEQPQRAVGTRRVWRRKRVQVDPGERTVAVMDGELDVRCNGCGLVPDEIGEYRDAARDAETTPEAYVRSEEGTYNPENGHFLCTDCYIKAGMPSSPRGWVAP